MSVLESIVAARRRALSGLRRSAGRWIAEARAAPVVRPLAPALAREVEVALIAEHKRRSPSAGWIRRDSDPGAAAAAYARAGAAALSVLTEREHFGGDLADLGAARAACDLPVLRKDFLLDPIQATESRAAGADAVLLIVRILDDGALAELLSATRELGMEALVEAHDPEELERALVAGARVVGLNSRDLATFRTDLSRAEALASTVPGDVLLVGESGIRGPGSVERLGAAGFDAVLVGESLMRSPDLQAAAAALTGRPRLARARGRSPAGRPETAP